MQDLIHTFKPDATALSFDEVINACPAVLTETASPETSDRYGFISTHNAMQVLGDYGYRPTKAIQRPSRNPQKTPFNMHMITFAHDESLLNPYADSRPEIILYNSHDRSSALSLYSGLYRFICSNGIVAGKGFNAKLRHSHKTANGFENLLQETAKGLPELMNRIDRLENTNLDREQVLDFVFNAAQLRWEQAPEQINAQTKNGVYFNDRTLAGVNLTRRHADQGASAWNVFNRVQENILKGGPRVVSITDRIKDKGQYFGKIRKSKGISSLPETIRVNQSLWNLSNAFA